MTGSAAPSTCSRVRDGDEDRQRTLRLTIRWSYDRLSQPQQALLRAVCAFPGGVDLAAVEELATEVGSGEDPVRLLHGLVDASLIDVDRSVGPATGCCTPSGPSCSTRSRP